MSATLLIISLIGSGAITFYVRFLIALYKEGQNRIGEVKKIYPQIHEFMIRKADRQHNPGWSTKWPRRNVWHA